MNNQYKCQECELVYTLSNKRIREESPIQGSFTCDLCKDEGDSISWGELAELTHATQVERFGWCICEDTNGEGQLHDDCPREGE